MEMLTSPHERAAAHAATGVGAVRTTPLAKAGSIKRMVHFVPEDEVVTYQRSWSPMTETEDGSFKSIASATSDDSDDSDSDSEETTRSQGKCGVLTHCPVEKAAAHWTIAVDRCVTMAATTSHAAATLLTLPSESPKDPIKLSSLLAHAGSEELATLFASASLVALQPGEALIRQDEPCNSLYLVLAGGLRITRATADGRVRALTTLANGAIVGELSFLLGGAPEVTATATDDALQIAAQDRSTCFGVSASSMEEAANALALPKWLRSSLRCAPERRGALVAHLTYAEAARVLEGNRSLMSAFLQALATTLARRIRDTSQRMKELIHASPSGERDAAASHSHRSPYDLARLFGVACHSAQEAATMVRRAPLAMAVARRRRAPVPAAAAVERAGRPSGWLRWRALLARCSHPAAARRSPLRRPRRPASPRFTSPRPASPRLAPPRLA